MSLVLLLRLADEAISYGFSVQTRIGGFMRQAIGFKPNTISQIGVILAGFARLVVIMIAIMALLAPWGIQSEDVVGTFASAFFGFEIGGFSFSPSAILGAIVVFIIVIVATRGFQRWLDGRLLPQTSLDAGLRTSIHTGVGYVGAAIAGLVAFPMRVSIFRTSPSLPARCPSVSVSASSPSSTTSSAGSSCSPNGPSRSGTASKSARTWGSSSASASGLPRSRHSTM